MSIALKPEMSDGIPFTLRAKAGHSFRGNERRNEYLHLRPFPKWKYTFEDRDKTVFDPRIEKKRIALPNPTRPLRGRPARQQGRLLSKCKGCICPSGMLRERGEREYLP